MTLQQIAVDTEEPVVTLHSVSKLYQSGGSTRQALKQVNLTVRRGTIQGIIGFSGAGKSTLLRCISRLETPNEGQVLVDGADLAQMTGEQLRSARRRIGVVFQQFHLLQSRTVAGNIALPLEIAGVSDSAIHERVKELLCWFGLEEHAAHYPSQLSGGQQQRVAIARALAAKPAVLLSDEPTSALDSETTSVVLELLRRVRDELGVTILLITHEIQAVRSICDRVAVLEAGRIVEEGPVDQVFLRPQSSAARRLIGNAVDFSHVISYIGTPTEHANSIFCRLLFRGPGATSPVLSEITRRTHARVNILNAEIGKLDQSAYGLMLVEICGDRDARDSSLRILAECNVEADLVDPWKELAEDNGAGSEKQGIEA
jgi:D-methionine transport system ATP-binding protein